MQLWNVKPSTARRWAPIVRAYEASGDSVPVYARAHGLNDRTLRWWQSYFRRVGLPAQDSAPAPPAPPAPPVPPVTFVPVEVQVPAVALSSPSPAAQPLELRLTAVNATIAVTAETDLALLRRVVEALC